MTLRERLVASVTDVRDRTQRLAELNRELLAAEMKEKGGRVGGAAALFAGAGLLAAYALGFALATVAVALALVLPLWASLLIVTAVLLVVVAVLTLVGRSLLRQTRTAVPETAAAEARLSAELVRSEAARTARGLRERLTSGAAAADLGAADTRGGHA